MPDTVREYRFIPLSPVHIGSGEKLSPEDYVVDGEFLVRFDPREVVRTMNDAGRLEYEQKLDAGRMDDALRFLRNYFTALQKKSGGRSNLEKYRTTLGRGSASEIRKTVEEPQRRKGEIHALIRNPYSGSVVIPGSAVKGAIRTAVLSCNVNPGGQPDQRVARELERERDGNRKAHRLEELGFDFERRHMECDPFRLVEVADAEWPADEVRVDKAALEKLGRETEQTAGMQVHLERLLAEADGGTLPECRIRIQINEEALRNRRVREMIQRPVTWDFLQEHCNTFFTGRFNAEMTKFSSLLNEHISRWYPKLEDGDILLRVGRHCHFDSLSVDNFRQGWNAARKEPIYEIGSTRTLCDLAGGGRAPFGWAMLRPV